MQSINKNDVSSVIETVIANGEAANDATVSTVAVDTIAETISAETGTEPVSVETAPKPKRVRKPASKPEPVKPAAPVAPVSFGGFSAGNVSRTARTVALDKTHFGGVTSDRDTAYLALFLDTARLNKSGRTVTLAALAERSTNHFYTGSAKPHDAGAINRARKAGNIEPATDGTSLTFTDRGFNLASAALKKLRPNA